MPPRPPSWELTRHSFIWAITTKNDLPSHTALNMRADLSAFAPRTVTRIARYVWANCLDLPQRQERDLVQAIAWLKLAADQGHAEARNLVDKESFSLTPEQVSAVLRLKAQLVHKP